MSFVKSGTDEPLKIFRHKDNTQDDSSDDPIPKNEKVETIYKRMLEETMYQTTLREVQHIDTLLKLREELNLKELELSRASKRIKELEEQQNCQGSSSN